MKVIKNQKQKQRQKQASKVFFIYFFSRKNAAELHHQKGDSLLLDHTQHRSARATYAPSAGRVF